MNIIILGPQGSGKGTQAEKLAERFDLEHIDMGKFLREVAKQDTALGREVHDIINVKKELVSDEILKKVLHVKIQGLAREKGIVFDGVPRKEDQLRYFEEAMQEFGKVLNKVILIVISLEESIDRISKRRVCEKCKKVYIMGKDVKKEKSECVCGGKITKRIDDTSAGVKKRLDIYNKETKPVIDYFRKKNLVLEIDGEKNPEEVFRDIIKNLEEVS